MISVINGKKYNISDNAPKPVVLGVPSYPVMIYRDANGVQFKQVRYNVINDEIYETVVIKTEFIPQEQPKPEVMMVKGRGKIILPKIKNEERI